jgi:hypothetical protein
LCSKKLATPHVTYFFAIICIQTNILFLVNSNNLIFVDVILLLATSHVRAGALFIQKIVVCGRSVACKLVFHVPIHSLLDVSMTSCLRHNILFLSESSCCINIYLVSNLRHVSIYYLLCKYLFQSTLNHD